MKTINAYNIDKDSVYGYHIGYKVTPTNYLIRTDSGSYGRTTILGKCITISQAAIQAAIAKSDKEWINIFNNYNKALVSEINGKLHFNAYVLTDSEIERHLLLNSDISDKEKLAQLATIPSREGLLTMLAGGMIAIAKDLSICLDLYAKQKEEN